MKSSVGNLAYALAGAVWVGFCGFVLGLDFGLVWRVLI